MSIFEMYYTLKQAPGCLCDTIEGNDVDTATEKLKEMIKNQSTKDRPLTLKEVILVIDKQSPQASPS